MNTDNAIITFMHQSKPLQFIYTLFIGILVATFIGLGIDAFYEKPVAPEYPEILSQPKQAADPTKAYEPTQEEISKQREYEKNMKEYDRSFKSYNQNVSIIALVFSILILAVSLTLMKNLQLISDGLLLGGLITLLYSVIRGFMTDSSKFRFSVVTAGLITALIIGYLKFVKSQNAMSNPARPEM